MKILIITTPQELGGGEIYVESLIKGLPQHRFLVLTSLQEFIDRLNSDGIQSHRLMMNVKFLSRIHIILFLILAPFNIIQHLFYLLIFNPDIVHIQSREEQVLVTPIARLLGKKVIWTLHGPTEKGNSVVDYLFLKSSLIVNEIIAVSNFIRKSMESFGIKKQSILIYHGVDLNKFKPLNSNNGKKIIGYIGRLVRVKRPELYLDAAIEILKKLDQVEAWIVGDGDQRVKMESKASMFTFKNRIKFLGFRKDIEDIVRQFTFLLVTSQTEGLDISALEAIASGVPVASVKVGALPEIINKETGLLIDSNDPKAIASSLLPILKNKNLLKKFRNSCRKIAEKRFSLKPMLRETDLVYNLVQ